MSLELYRVDHPRSLESFYGDRGFTFPAIADTDKNVNPDYLLPLRATGVRGRVSAATPSGELVKTLDLHAGV
jgi:hypothetical protein